MTKAKRFLSLIISLLLLLSLATPVFAEETGEAGQTAPQEEQDISPESPEDEGEPDSDLPAEPEDTVSPNQNDNETEEPSSPDSEEEAPPASQEDTEDPETAEEAEEPETEEEPEPDAQLLDVENTVFLNYADEANRVGFTDLLTAVADDTVTDGSVLTVTADQELTERLYIKKNLTITDDGTPRTIYVYNSGSGSANGYGRGIQVNAGKFVTIKGSAFGNLTVCGRSKNIDESSLDYIYNYQQALYAYNGTFCLENLIVTECSPSYSSTVGAAVYVDTANGGKLQLNNCSFSNNTCSASGADIYVAAGTDVTSYTDILTLSGEVIAGDVSYNLTNPIVLSSGFSASSSVSLHLPSDLLADGAQLLSGDETALANAPGHIVPCDLAANLKLNTSGYIEERKVAEVNGTKYATLADAVTAAATGQTVTLIDDAPVDSRISITSKSITITDDGNPHTIYFYNTERTSTYGRGIQLNGYSQTLNITATKKGNITIVGHSPDGSVYNYSGVIVASGSTINLNNIILTECAPTTYGAIYTIEVFTKEEYRVGTVNLNNCTIENNTAVNSNGGAAIYNKGCVNINSGTVITGNCSTSAVSGGIYNDVYPFSDTDPTVITAVTNINSGATVSGNLKNCSSHEDFGVAADGKASDVYASVPESIVLNSNPASVGIDYAGNDRSQFGITASSSVSQCSGLFSNTDSTLTPYVSSSKLYWGSFFTMTPGSASNVSGLSYNLSDATVAITGGTGAALTVSTDGGSFLVPWSSFSPSNSAFNLTKISYVTAEGEYGELTAIPETDAEYAGLCVYASWNQTDAQSFIRSICFTTPGSGITQNVTFDVFKSVSSGSLCFGGSTYSYVSGAYSASRAETLAIAEQANLAVITSKTENDFLKGAFGSEGWLGGILSSDCWYWRGGENDGLRISASSNTNRGYEGAFVSWAEGEPSTGNSLCFSNGLWYAADSEASKGYYVELEDSNACVVSTALSVTAEKPSLRSMSINLDSGFSANYYFYLPQEYINSDTAKIEVCVGSGETITYLVKDVAVEANLWDKDGSYKLTVPFSACQMNADVSISLYNDAGSLVRSYGGAGRNSNYNLRWYAETVILKQTTGDKYNTSFSADLVSYVKAMLNYGAAAQQQFLDEPGELADEGYEYTGELITASDLSSTAVLSHDNTSVSYVVSLIAGSSTAIRLYPVGLSGFTATVDSQSVTTSSDTNGSFIEIEISPDKLSRTYTVSFSGNFTDEVRINAVGAIQGVLSSGADTDASLTADRLYRLSLAANKYFGVYTPAASTVEAVISTAYAYLAKTQYVDYDQRSMAYNNISLKGFPVCRRRQMTVEPEDISAQNPVYMDCSSFVWNVYRSVFGQTAVEEALDGLSMNSMNTENMKNVSNEARVAYYSDPDADTINDMLSLLQPGDLIVKFNTSSDAGHVVLWTGNGYIHCTGASFNYNDSNPDSGVDKVESEGALHYVPAESFKSSWYSGYDIVVILRPLNLLDSDDVLSSGNLHRQTGGIAVSKTAVSGTVELFKGQSVTTGSQITYTVKLENPARTGALSTTRTVNVTDSLPSGTAFSAFTGDYTGTVSGSQISWENISVPVGGTVELSYTVTVSAEAGTSLEATSASVLSTSAGSLSGTADAANCDITVESECASTVQALLTAANARLTDESDGISDINALLSAQSLNTLGSSDTDWIDALFKKTSGYYYVYPSSDSTLYSNLVANFAAGRYVLNYTAGGGNFNTETRVRNITVSNLRAGDIIAVYNSKQSQYRYYIYDGNGSLIQFISGEDIIAVDASAILSKLPNMTCFAVFRFAGR